MAPEAAAPPERALAPHTGPTRMIPVRVQDGQVVVEGGLPLLEGLPAGAFVSAHDQQSLVLGLAAPGGATAQFDTALGQLRCRRFLACARCKLWWMTPEWGSAAGEVPPETQFLLVELAEGGPYAALLPLIDSNTFRATLRPPSATNGNRLGRRGAGGAEQLHLRIESGDASVTAERWAGALYVAAGWDPYELADKAVAGAAALSGGAKPRRAKQLPESLDLFGWCTWDAFYSRVSARGLSEGLASLAEGGVPPRFLIIDDGWQQTDVDPAWRKPPTSRLNLPEAEATEDEYLEAEMEILALGAKDVPPSSSAGVALAALTAEEGGAALEHHHRHARRSREDRKAWLGRPDLPDFTDNTAASGSSLMSRSGDELAPPAAVLPPPPLQPPPEDENGASPSAVAQLERSDAHAGKAGANGAGGAHEAAALVQRLQQNGSVQAEEAAEGGVKEVEAEVVPPAGEALVVAEPHKGTFLGRLVSMLTQRLVGGIMGGLEFLFLKFYQYVVDPAPPGSWPVRLWAWLSNGPLRGMLLDFFAASGDFTRRLTSVRANPKFSSPAAGPEDFFADKQEDLKGVVAHLKERFQLRYVYCWHALSAYWSGVSPDDPEVAKYNSKLQFAIPTPGLLEIEPSAAWNPSVVAGVGAVDDPAQLYHDMHAYLRDAGVNGVKVDGQAGVGMIGSALGGGPALAARFHAALEDSIRRHFPGNHCINCMCHSTENIYRMADTAVVRASDDFYPRDKNSSLPHLAACAYNSMFLAALAQPDWDMFHSKHTLAPLHAVARAVSGGSVYVSDAPGQHDFDLLRRLVLPDGRVPRSLLPARPTRDSLFTDVLRDGKSMLKVWNVNRCGGVVAVFNLQGASWSRTRRQFITHDASPPELTATVRPADVELFAAADALGPEAGGLLGSAAGGSLNGNGTATAAREAWADAAAAQSWVAYTYHDQALRRLRSSDGVETRLAAGQASVVTLAPVHEAGGAAFAAVGIAQLYNSGACVLACALEEVAPAGRQHSFWGRAGNGNGTTAPAAGVKGSVQVSGSGALLMYSSRRPQQCLLAGQPVEFTYGDADGRLAVDLPVSDAQHEVAVLLPAA